MTVTAIDAQPPDVVLMAKRDRLVAVHSDAGEVVGTDELGPGGAKRRQHENRPKNAHSGDGVEAAMEDLGHAGLPFP
jgi:hypothetical protein